MNFSVIPTSKPEHYFRETEISKWSVLSTLQWTAALLARHLDSLPLMTK